MYVDHDIICYYDYFSTLAESPPPPPALRAEQLLFFRVGAASRHFKLPPLTKHRLAPPLAAAYNINEQYALQFDKCAFLTIYFNIKANKMGFRLLFCMKSLNI